MAQTPTGDGADTWEKVLFLFLGWLLATLSPIIADAIRRRRDSKQVKSALLAELGELKYRMAVASYYANMRFGAIDRAFLQWLRGVVAGYHGPAPADNVLKAVEMQLSLPEQALSSLLASERSQGKSGLTLKKYAVPLLDARLAVLTSLPTSIQVLLLEVRTHLRMLDEEVDDTRYYFQLTFDPKVAGNNRQAVEQNLENGYRQYGDRARIVAEKIAKLEQAWV